MGAHALGRHQGALPPMAAANTGTGPTGASPGPLGATPWLGAATRYASGSRASAGARPPHFAPPNFATVGPVAFATRAPAPAPLGGYRGVATTARGQATEGQGQAADGVGGPGSGGKGLGRHAGRRGLSVVCHIQGGGGAADAANVKRGSAAGGADDGTAGMDGQRQVANQAGQRRGAVPQDIRHGTSAAAPATHRSLIVVSTPILGDLSTPTEACAKPIRIS